MSQIKNFLVFFAIFALSLLYSNASKSDPDKERFQPASTFNQTLSFIVTQQFLTRISSGFTYKTLNGLLKAQLVDIPFEIDLDIIKLDLNVTNVNFTYFDSFREEILIITNDSIRVNISNQSINLNVSYEFVTDPPILADFGDLLINSTNLNCFFNLMSTYDSQNGSDFYFDSIDPGVNSLSLDMDGISDIGEVITYFSNAVSKMGILTLKSLTQAEYFPAKLAALLNKGINMLPYKYKMENNFTVEYMIPQPAIYYNRSFMQVPVYIDF